MVIINNFVLFKVIGKKGESPLLIIPKVVANPLCDIPQCKLWLGISRSYFKSIAKTLFLCYSKCI